MTTPYERFVADCQQELILQGQDEVLRAASLGWLQLANYKKYSYHFEWLGRPIIQYPQDIMAMQELIWRTQPDLIIETGIAHGGSLVFYSSMLELNAMCGGPQNSVVLGIDVDIRPHNRAAIEAHPMCRRIEMIEGSSIAPEIVEQVSKRAAGKRQVLVCLDSNHSHEHVLAELEAYAPLTSVGSYCVVFDTIIEDLPKEMFLNRPWGPGDNPKTAVRKFLEHHSDFEVSQEMDAKLLISVAPGGYLRRIR